jgi:hypothetical protein
MGILDIIIIAITLPLFLAGWYYLLVPSTDNK